VQRPGAQSYGAVCPRNSGATTSNRDVETTTHTKRKHTMLRTLDRRIHSPSLVIRILAVGLATALASVVLLASSVLATPSSGLSMTPIAAGSLANPIPAKFKAEGGFGAPTSVANVVVAKFEVEPGGTFGWHQHGGPVWAIVASGTLTLYSGDDPTCTPVEVSAGAALLDDGDHTHSASNLGSETVVIYATFMLPDGGLPRIDVADPGNCS
jgi:quercetin dioxygenase-like cupin family protein